MFHCENGERQHFLERIPMFLQANMLRHPEATSAFFRRMRSGTDLYREPLHNQPSLLRFQAGRVASRAATPVADLGCRQLEANCKSLLAGRLRVRLPHFLKAPAWVDRVTPHQSTSGKGVDRTRAARVAALSRNSRHITTSLGHSVAGNSLEAQNIVFAGKLLDSTG